MITKKESFKEFKERTLHDKEDLFAILFISPITIRLTYLIKKWNLNISPNQVTFTRLFVLSPLIIICLLLASLLGWKIFYLFVIILSYLFLLSDWLDGQIARGLNKVSYTGILFDSIADRFLTIIFITMIFSIGVYFSNSILIYGAILLFVLKIFHLMAITKIFYYGTKTEYMGKIYMDKKKTMQTIFAGDDTFKTMGVFSIRNILQKINSFLKIKRWSENIGGSERYFFTIILPLILIVIELNSIAIILVYFLLIFYIIFFILRIKNLLKSYIY